MYCSEQVTLAKVLLPRNTYIATQANLILQPLLYVLQYFSDIANFIKVTSISCFKLKVLP